MNNSSEIEFKNAIIKCFGTQCEVCIDELYDRICKDVAAKLYCGLGDNTVSQNNQYAALNVLFANFK